MTSEALNDPEPRGPYFAETFSRWIRLLADARRAEEALRNNAWKTKWVFVRDGLDPPYPIDIILGDDPRQQQLRRQIEEIGVPCDIITFQNGRDIDDDHVYQEASLRLPLCSGGIHLTTTDEVEVFFANFRPRTTQDAQALDSGGARQPSP